MYLSKYPKGVGHYSELAELRLAALDKTAPANPPPSVAPVAPAPQVDVAALKTEDANIATESALSLDNAQWRNVQSHLAGAGFYTSGIDGSVGDGTRKAIYNWQTARQYKASGFLNKPQMDALLTMEPAAQTQTRPAVVAQRPVYHTRQTTGTGLVNPGPAIFGTMMGVFACKATHTC